MLQSLVRRIVMLVLLLVASRSVPPKRRAALLEWLLRCSPAQSMPRVVRLTRQSRSSRLGRSLRWLIPDPARRRRRKHQRSDSRGCRYGSRCTRSVPESMRLAEASPRQERSEERDQISGSATPSVARMLNCTERSPHRFPTLPAHMPSMQHCCCYPCGLPSRPGNARQDSGAHWQTRCSTPSTPGCKSPGRALPRQPSGY